MNENHIQQIFQHYMDNFEYLNSEKGPNNEDGPNEVYKWYAGKGFRPLMDIALAASAADFPKTLYEALKCSENLIDSYTTPFYGMIDFARREPETVRQMFLDLYEGDQSDLVAVQKRIDVFYNKNMELLEKYNPGSFMYKPDFHAISGYLFLYYPEEHYMYKASNANIFADCIEFYDDWGSGMNVKLDVYYRMCDWVVEQIMNSPALIATDRSRFELPRGAEMAPDANKHILLFDLIYCSSVYDLFKGITFVRPKSKEKHLIAEKRKEAIKRLADYNAALEEQHKFDDALYLIRRHLVPGTVLHHKANGKGIVQSCNEKCTISVLFNSGVQKQLGAQTLFANGLAKTEEGVLEQLLEEFKSVLGRETSISNWVKYTKNELEPYKDYL